MGGQTERVCLQHQRHGRGTRIVRRAAVHFALVGERMGGHGNQHRCGCVPALVERHQGGESLLEGDFIDAAVEYEETPRLRVVRRRCPASRFQHGTQMLTGSLEYARGLQRPAISS
jgi:hypothetical protein